MIGAIIGYIVGSTYEFHNTQNYDFELFHQGISFTDDTIPLPRNFSLAANIASISEKSSISGMITN